MSRIFAGGRKMRRKYFSRSNCKRVFRLLGASLGKWGARIRPHSLLLVLLVDMLDDALSFSIYLSYLLALSTPNRVMVLNDSIVVLSS